MVGTIADMILDMESGIYDFTVNGECSQCGGCCSDILPVSSKEIKEIKRYVKSHKIRESAHFVPTNNPIEWDMTCPFRDNSKRICTIYEVRPAICREFCCDKPRKHIMANKNMFHGRYDAISMRKTFFMEEK